MDSKQPPIWAPRDGADRMLDLHVQPGAKCTAVPGEHGGRLKLKIVAQAVDNRANVRLPGGLATQPGVPKASVCLTRGETSRQKTVAVRGVEMPCLDIGNSKTK